jgi:hypothetical protein
LDHKAGLTVSDHFATGAKVHRDNGHTGRIRLG